MSKSLILCLFVISKSVLANVLNNIDYNDYNQLKKYIGLTNLDEKALFDEWTNCQNLLSQNYGRNWRCVPHQSERIAEMPGTFKWPRQVTSDSKLSIDCEYTISDKNIIGDSNFRFYIEQKNCKFNSSIGGSSFQISGVSKRAVSPCSIQDHFNGTYEIICLNVECQARKILSQNHHTAFKIAGDSSQSCLNLTVILDYEHFDAFSETKSSEPPLRHIITNSSYTCKTTQEYANCPVEENFWVHNYGTHDLSDYEWISNKTADGSFPLIKSIQNCLKSEKRNIFLYDGQLSLISQYLQELYVNSNPQNGYKIQNVYRNFVLDTVDYFGSEVNRMCGDGIDTNLIFEFGGWDLRHTPPRNLISNPLTVKELIKRINSTLSSEKCYNVKMIWLSIHPAHRCIYSKTSCLHEIDNTWSNNYATNAVNQYFHNVMIELSKSNKRLKIIDRYSILYPRLLNEMYVCNNEFVCKIDGDILGTTSSFRVIVSEILRTICDESNIDWDKGFSRVDKFYRVSNYYNQSFHFYTTKGLRRRIPDQETLKSLLRQTGHYMNTSIQELTESELHDIPQDPSIQAYTTRASGTLIKDHSAKIYLMSNGYRRPLSNELLSNHTGLLHNILGTDHSNVMTVPINDLNIIPEGPIINDINILIREIGANSTDVDSSHVKKELFLKTVNRTYAKLLPCLFNSKILSPNQVIKFPFDAEGHYYDLLERTSIFRNQPYHYYSGYDGPWIENYFIKEFIDKPLYYFNGLIPLFVQWVDVMIASDFPEIIKLMREILRPDVMYFTVSQSDKGLEKVQLNHPNILCISAGGYGHIPIPLIKSEVEYLSPLKSYQYQTIFFGNIKQHSRPEAFANIDKTFPKYNISYKIGTYLSSWTDALRNTRFPMAPRGFGRSSFRFSEIVQAGRCPMYIYDDYCWLPYQGTNISIETYGFAVRNSDTMEELAQKLVNISDDQYNMYIQKVKDIRYWFTYKGVIEQIRLFISDPLGKDGGYLRCTRVPDNLN